MNHSVLDALSQTKLKFGNKAGTFSLMELYESGSVWGSKTMVRQLDVHYLTDAMAKAAGFSGEIPQKGQEMNFISTFGFFFYRQLVF